MIPVVRRLMADAETPVGLYRKLAQDRPGTFLLESAEHGGVWSRYSIVGARSHAVLTEVGRTVRSGPAASHRVGVPRDGEPLDVVERDCSGGCTRRANRACRHSPGGWSATSATTPCAGGSGSRPSHPTSCSLPEVGLMLATDLAVLDHADGTVLLIANAINYDATDERVDEAWRDAVARLDAMTADLAVSASATVAVVDVGVEPPYASRTERADFLRAVERAKEAIRAGETFQIVVSQRFEIDCPADSLDVYRVLRGAEPEPLHVPAALRRIRHRGVQPRGTGQGRRRASACAPDRRHPVAGRHTRGGRGARCPSCWLTRRSGPST